MTNHEEVMLYISNKLKDYRYEHTLSQLDLAIITGVGQSSIARLETMKLKTMPDLKTLAFLTQFTMLDFKITIENGKIVVE